MTQQRPLPEFDAPPVDEVVLGVDFPSIDGWKIPYAGLFWQQIRGEYPHCDVQPPVTQQIESFPPSQDQPGFRVLSDPNLIRCWFLDDSRNELLQIQPDKFLRNWRQVTGAEVYPRYSSLRPRFERDWSRFLRFLDENRFTEPQTTQCEVAYINNIERGAGWESFADLPRVTPLWAGRRTDGFLNEPESASIALSYAMEEKIGRLRVNLNHAIRSRDGKEILQLQLTARGRPASSSTTDILEWLDRGREWIVRSFADITTPEMHRIWKRRA